SSSCSSIDIGSQAHRIAMKSFYRDTLRRVRLLPPQLQPYYYSMVQGGFKAHVDENDSEQIDHIIKSAKQQS
ncbi:LYR motif-containing protein, partial [Acinetobacter baumannii]|uniref:LYR motif-containing protein n=1 Tax=Acinetobacter baumannii TaxID=470 RepID=UPI0031F470C7